METKSEYREFKSLVSLWRGHAVPRKQHGGWFGGELRLH